MIGTDISAAETYAARWLQQPQSSQGTPSTGSVASPHDDNSPTLVTLDVSFAFASPVHAAVSAAFFGQVSKRMVEAFEERCQEIYVTSRK